VGLIHAVDQTVAHSPLHGGSGICGDGAAIDEGSQGIIAGIDINTLMLGEAVEEGNQLLAGNRLVGGEGVKGLAVDNSIHIITRFRQEYRGDRTVNEALRMAMRSSGRAIMQSNTMLCSGLIVLALSDFDPILRVGVLTITTIVAALVVTMLVLPAEIACMGHKMRLPRFAHEANAQDSQDSQASQDTLNETKEASEA
jgi:hypothetical protein